MEFIFTPRAKALSDADFLADLRRVAELLGKRSITVVDYENHGRYRPGTFRRFGHWAMAVEKAGLKRNRRYGVTADMVLSDIRRVGAKLLTRSLLLKQYGEHGKYSTCWVWHHFGQWEKAVRAAGLSCPDKYRRKTPVELFENLERVWTGLGRQPNSGEMIAPLSAYSVGPYKNCFGSWQKALEAFAAKYSGGKKANVSRLKKIVPVHRTSRWVKPGMRYLVMERDNFRCRLCGRSPATDAGVKLQVDHIKPWTRGGETVIENLQTLCQTCNGGKGNRLSPAARMGN